MKHNLSNFLITMLTAIATLVSIFGWLGITPEMASDATYRTIGIILPFIVAFFSFIFGWNAHKFKMNRENNNKALASGVSLSECLQVFKDEPCGEKKAVAAYIYMLPEHRAIISDAGSQRLQEMDYSFNYIPDRKVFYRFDSRGGNTTYIELEPWLIALFNSNKELLDEFPREPINKVESFFDHYDPTMD